MLLCDIIYNYIVLFWIVLYYHRLYDAIMYWLYIYIYDVLVIYTV